MKQIREAYTCKYCPFCKTWLYVDDGPYYEDDDTKPIGGVEHIVARHPETIDKSGIPYLEWNEVAAYAADWKETLNG